MINNNNSRQRFRRFSSLTIVVVFLLIFIGGIVRSTGSGMGCPDWPKCFGQFVPPTHISQLPADYKAQYAEIRLKKNERFAKVVKFLGYHAFADQILNDPTVYQEADFNPIHTWIEYVNRLFGVLTGLFIIATLVFSFKAFKGKAPFYFSLAAFVLVLVQGLVGAFVVSSNLAPGVITVHLLLALVIVNLLIHARIAASETYISTKLIIPAYFNWFVFLALVLILIQIIWGTQVREAVDVALLNKDGSSVSLFKQIGFVFSRHKAFSSMVGLAVFATVLLSFKYLPLPALRRAGIGLLVLTLLQIISGLIMNAFGFVAGAQALHIFVASLMFGLTYFIFAASFMTGRQKNYSHE